MFAPDEFNLLTFAIKGCWSGVNESGPGQPGAIGCDA